MTKRNKDRKKVFDDFNSQLGENSLPEKYKDFDKIYEEQQEISALIEKQIRDISLGVIQLKEKQQVLESIISAKESETSIDNKNKTLDDVQYTEEEIHKYMQMAESSAPLNSEHRLIKKPIDLNNRK